MLRRVAPFLLSPPLPCYRVIGHQADLWVATAAVGMSVSKDLCFISLFTYKSVNDYPRNGARPHVDVRDPRISLLFQEVPVRPPASLFMLLVLPYPSCTLLGAYSLLSPAFGDPTLACAGAYESMHRAAHAGGG